MINPAASTRLRVLAMAVVALSMLQPGIAQAQNIRTVAGNGTQGFSGDGGPALSASLGLPDGVAVDAAGNRYIADSHYMLIRRVTPAGIISTVAGNGTTIFSGDGGPATSAGIGTVYKLAVDAYGNLYLADLHNNRIRKVTAGGTINTIAGTGNWSFSGDGGPATSAGMTPNGIAVDATGNVFFTDYWNDRVRRITPGGVISTVAGNGSRGFSGDGGPATSARLNGPYDVTVDATGNLYISDLYNYRIRKVAKDGTISTVAGNGDYGYNGDGGAATAASLTSPFDVELDAGGSLYIADREANRIRKVTPAGVISTVAGNGSQGFSGDGGPATSAQLNFPRGLAIAQGRMYITDSLNRRLRAVSLFASCADEGYSGTRLSMCRQACETDQSPARLMMLIKLYVTNYRDTPPCAR